MKYLFFALLLNLTACTSYRPSLSENGTVGQKLVSFRVHNNSILPHKYAFIGYEPGQVGNWTNIIIILPGGYHRFKCPVGTKIYLADEKQVGIVMGGGSIRKDEPFLTVKAEDAGRVFPLGKIK
ncbi:MAG: hypothetical protein NW218_12595 [Saprospiraceae bacterium]|nr:hypothetical protein [Saprospiraceae bacterium]